nr:hypothetical protein [Streptomyces misionensis]
MNSGYTYNTFGRTTALPGTAIGYYTNDLVQQQTAGDQRQTWTLDSALRRRGLSCLRERVHPNIDLWWEL